MYSSVSASPATASPERRRTPRVEVLGQLHGSIVALRMTVVVREVGPGGFSIDTPVPFPKQSTHQFRFSTCNGHADVVLRAESAHCLGISARGAEPRYLTGFTFVCDDDESRRAVETLVEALAGVAASES